jgi:hypothetical protein
MNLEIIKTGIWLGPEAQRLEQALNMADQMDHKLSNHVLNMSGMSGRKYRTMINRLVEITPNARYLEIGSWRGSTACAAMYDNRLAAVCIDSWQEGEDIYTDFVHNVNYILSDKINFTHIREDFVKVDYNSIGKFNIYMFDGPHRQEDQYNGVALAQPALDDTYILIVDDYNDSQVQQGTTEALAVCNQTVVASVVILTHNNPYLSGSDWHNGYFIAVIKKGNQ